MGKSTLFNRLIGKKLAITDPTPGVTRDPIYERYILAGHPVTLVDSGGMKVERDKMDQLVYDRSLSLWKDADVIVLLMDCMEVTGEDENLLKMLRPYTDKVVVVVNKIDDPTREDRIWNYFSYGYQRVVGISASHGNGIEELEDTLLGMLSLEETYDVPEEIPAIKLSIMGKPNTGKSTLMNLLTSSDLSIVSDIPGTTRDVVRGSFVFKDNNIRILDTAGIRRKSKVEEDVEYYSVNRAIKSIDDSDVVLLMVDSTEGLAEQDKKIAQLIVRRGCGVIIVLNKVDKLPKIPNAVEAVEDRVRFLFPILGFAPMIPISALENRGIEELLDTVLKVWSQLNRRVDTSTVNEALKKWAAVKTPPRSKTGYYKILYATQVTANPVRFLMFVNKTKGFPEDYLSYLKNCLRRDLGFKYIPVEITLRERERNEARHNDRSKSLTGEQKTGKKGGIKDRKEAGETVGRAEIKAIRARRDAQLKPVIAKPTGGKAKAKAPKNRPGNLAARDKARKRK